LLGYLTSHSAGCILRLKDDGAPALSLSDRRVRGDAVGNDCFVRALRRPRPGEAPRGWLPATVLLRAMPAERREGPLPKEAPAASRLQASGVPFTRTATTERKQLYCSLACQYQARSREYANRDDMSARWLLCGGR
jgi:hypothetical protein